MPIRHGLTMGELAQLFNGEKKIGADLTVVAMKNWRRDAWFDETGLAVDQSVAEHAQSATQATLYPGIGAFESTNISVGRGTDTPFEHVGAPWIDGVRLADALNARQIPGVRFYPVRFTPTSSKFAGEECQGVFIVVTDRNARAAGARRRRDRVGAREAVSRQARDRRGGAAVRIGGRLARIKAGDDPATIAASWSGGEGAVAAAAREVPAVLTALRARYAMVMRRYV